MPARKTIKSNTYRNYPINSKHGGCYDSWLDNLIDLSEYAKLVQTRPAGYVVSFQLMPGVTISQIQDNLVYFFQHSKNRKKNPCVPLWVCKYEEKMLTVNCPEYPDALNPTIVYGHYHMGIILDHKHITDKSFSLFFHQQKTKGLIHHYKVSKRCTRFGGKKSIHKMLKTEMSDWIQHASYLCKLDTAAGKKPFSTCRFKAAFESLKAKKLKQAEKRLAISVLGCHCPVDADFGERDRSFR